MLQCKYLVIGSGETGLKAVNELVKTGKKVILVDQHEIGGSYLHSLDYTKHLLIKESEDFATNLRGFKNYPDTFSILRKYRQKIEDKISEEVRQERNRILNQLEKTENLEIVYGKAEFTSKSLIEVNSNTERNLIGFETVVLAVGKNTLSKPSLNGIEKVNFLHKHNIFLFEKIPSKLAILDCTAENLEIASVYAGLGVKVNLFETNPVEKVLPKLDRSAFNYLIKSLMKRNVTFYFNTEIRSLKKDKDELILIDDNRKEYSHSDIFVSINEKFKDDGLGLNKVDVNFSSAGIEVNAQGKTNQGNVWAFGECASNNSHKNKYLSLFNFTDGELKKIANTGNSLFKITDIFGEKEITPFDFSIIKIEGYQSVRNIGLSERTASGIHGGNINVVLITDIQHKGFAKIVYKTNTQEVLGIILTGDFAVKLEYFALLTFKQNIPYRVVRNILKNALGV